MYEIWSKAKKDFSSAEEKNILEKCSALPSAEEKNILGKCSALPSSGGREHSCECSAPLCCYARPPNSTLSLPFPGMTNTLYTIPTLTRVPERGKAMREKWFRNFAQGDKWNFCLTAGTLVPANQERP
jgi:hypothetical protein